jgi:hypothetical protein
MLGRSSLPKNPEDAANIQCPSTRSHHYITHKDYNRPTIGRELLVALGFHDDIRLDGLDETALQTLVGNTISPAVMVVIWVLIFKNCSFSDFVLPVPFSEFQLKGRLSDGAIKSAIATTRVSRHSQVDNLVKYLRTRSVNKKQDIAPRRRILKKSRPQR